VELSNCYEKDENIVSREIGSETILVPVHRDVGDLNNVYSLNETAAFIWSHLDGKKTMEQIRDLMLEEYETNSVKAEDDLRKYVGQLLEINSIREVNSK
jgi:methyltransferase-like protein